MATTTNRSGITAGDQVLIYLHNRYEQRPRKVCLRYAEVERVTATQVVIEGISYHASPLHGRVMEAVKETDRYCEGDTVHTSGWRRFAHPNLLGTDDWNMLVAQNERPAELSRALAINDQARALFGLTYILSTAKVVALSAHPATMDALEREMQRTIQARQNELDHCLSYFRFQTSTEDTEGRTDKQDYYGSFATTCLQCGGQYALTRGRVLTIAHCHTCNITVSF